MNLETRVGYKTLNIINDALRDYIAAHTIDGRYEGRLDYLLKADKLNQYLR